MLRQFLQNVLGLTPEEYMTIKLLDTNQRVDRENSLSILDLTIETASGKILNVNMQLTSMKLPVKRLLFYPSRMLVDQPQQRQKYWN